MHLFVPFELLVAVAFPATLAFLFAPSLDRRFSNHPWDREWRVRDRLLYAVVAGVVAFLLYRALTLPFDLSQVDRTR